MIISSSIYATNATISTFLMNEQYPTVCKYCIFFILQGRDNSISLYFLLSTEHGSVDVSLCCLCFHFLWIYMQEWDYWLWTSSVFCFGGISIFFSIITILFTSSQQWMEFHFLHFSQCLLYLVFLIVTVLVRVRSCIIVGLIFITLVGFFL